MSIQSHNLLNCRFDSVCKIFWKNSCLSQELFQVVWGPQNTREDLGADGLEMQFLARLPEDPAMTMLKLSMNYSCHNEKRNNGGSWSLTPSCFVFPTLIKSRIVWLCLICLTGSILLSFSSNGCLKCGLSLGSLSDPSGFSLSFLIWEGEP